MAAMAAEGGEELSTVFVGGLPLDASSRELDNLCRFMPGFVNSKADSRKGKTLFARFDSQSTALNAIQMLQGQVFDRINPGEPMRAVLAKSNMKSDRPSRWSTPYDDGQPSPPPPSHPAMGASHYAGAAYDAPSEYGCPPVYSAPPGKRQRAPEHPGEVDTIACVGAAERGYDEASLHGFFTSLPGFVAFKANPRMGGGFVKFESPAMALSAIATAHQHGVPAEMAKSSMSTGPMGQPPPPSGPPPRGYMHSNFDAMQEQGHGHGTKRPRMAENPGQVDTVASVGAAERGVDEASLHAYFASLPGFVMFKPNPRMGGGFAKFESPEHAVEAAAAARQQGVPAELAKSSMNIGGVQAAYQAPLPQMPMPPPPSYALQAAKRPRGIENPGEVDTVAVVGAAERGFDEFSLQAFFQEQPGFLAFKPNPRMGGGFAKFESPGLAAQCVGKAYERGLNIEIARSSMSSVN